MDENKIVIGESSLKLFKLFHPEPLMAEIESSTEEPSGIREWYWKLPAPGKKCLYSHFFKFHILPYYVSVLS